MENETLMFSQFQLGLEIQDDAMGIDEEIPASPMSCPSSPFPGVRMTPRSMTIPALSLTPSSHNNSNVNAASGHISFSYGSSTPNPLASNYADSFSGFTSSSKEFSVHPSLFVHMSSVQPNTHRHRSTPVVPLFHLDGSLSGNSDLHAGPVSMSFDHEDDVMMSSGMPAFNGFVTESSFDFADDHGR
eukprot:TRINITY_DN2036_c0_g1_i1.p1 TRINITY_DN2036_c0_g1~~TRINITY_DN2036_c0_g1_i1.p1  ORF type:complete len:187 (-),score=29.93 TRINITY_DN2036_c0_g1_i1:244-804(-)